MKFGIISTANIARKALIPAMKRSDKAEVVAIASGSGQAQAVADEHGIPKAYDRYEDVLADPDIDAVYIPLPNHLHKEWVMKAAEAGKHILCEKPAGLNAREMEEMEAVCREHDVVFMEAFMYQFHKQHERVKELMAAGEIGDVTLVRASFSFPLREPAGNIRVDRHKGGGSIYDVGSYCLHTFQNILDDGVDEVFVEADMSDEFGVDMSAQGIVTMKSGVRGMFDSGFNTEMRHEYEVVGTHGTIKVSRAYRPDAFGHEGHVIVEKAGITRDERIMSDQYKEEVDHFVEAIEQGVEPRNSYDMSKQNMAAIDACYESVKTGRKVKV
ncbi:putative dehydrogenase [Alkalibacillus flavidus]|uniref:Dehydrogenase n=1 Tax=Alkalibacillus flavidus TaxID=546021 RepID=A0ABV2KWM0_9BACI